MCARLDKIMKCLYEIAAYLQHVLTRKMMKMKIMLKRCKTLISSCMYVSSMYFDVEYVLEFELSIFCGGAAAALCIRFYDGVDDSSPSSEILFGTVHFYSYKVILCLHIHAT